jgi:hypothetical protein
MFIQVAVVFASVAVLLADANPQQVLVQLTPAGNNASNLSVIPQNGANVAAGTQQAAQDGQQRSGKDCIWEGQSPFCKGKCGHGMKEIL